MKVEKTSLIRVSVRTLYDMQKLRIQSGNRIVASFKSKLGIEPSEAEDTEDNAEAFKILQQLRGEYKLLTTGVKRITKNFKPDSKLITTLGETRLIESYECQIAAEEVHAKLLEQELENYPIYTDYLKGIRGCGPLMSAVIISEVDIEKATSISALWKYCGLDVLKLKDEETGKEWGEGRCRKEHHLVPKTYVNKKKEVKHTVGITFNPILKTKLVGVLGGCFIKLGGYYRSIYDGYKNRLEHHPDHKDKSKSHRHHMAVRYMIKMFLADLWTTWRTMEGLPVRGTWAEEKLGLKHSKAA